ncbi:MAG TPA: hypothetical protein PLQ52_12925 [Lacunisphaera sp.]|nr:hypothetical protein [Lacunisphaera sp.]
MFETLLKYFEGSPLSLWGPFLVLILCGLGLPVPEDIVLVAAGALGEIDGRRWIEVSALMYAILTTAAVAADVATQAGRRDYGFCTRTV